MKLPPNCEDGEEMVELGEEKLGFFQIFQSDLYCPGELEGKMGIESEREPLAFHELSVAADPLGQARVPPAIKQ